MMFRSSIVQLVVLTVLIATLHTHATLVKRGDPEPEVSQMPKLSWLDKAKTKVSNTLGRFKSSTHNSDAVKKMLNDLASIKDAVTKSKDAGVLSVVQEQLSKVKKTITDLMVKIRGNKGTSSQTDPVQLKSYKELLEQDEKLNTPHGHQNAYKMNSANAKKVHPEEPLSGVEETKREDDEIEDPN
jgi:hypothetical protein